MIAKTAVLASIHRQASSPKAAVQAIATIGASVAPTAQTTKVAPSILPRCLRGRYSARREVAIG